MTRSSVIIILLGLLAIFVMGASAVAINSRQESDCQSLGGEYVATRDAQLCVRDGLIVKVYH
jgi:hypothetical protein